MSLEQHSRPRDFVPLMQTARLNYGKAADLFLDAHSALWRNKDKSINPDYNISINMVADQAKQPPFVLPQNQTLEMELMTQAQILAQQKYTKDDSVANMRKRFIDAKLIVSGKPADAIYVRPKSVEQTKKNLKALKFLTVMRDAFAAWQYDSTSAPVQNPKSGLRP